MDRNTFRPNKRLKTVSVALRKESVDRNDELKHGSIIFAVALRKESVDRNRVCSCYRFKLARRSPQGERG